MTKINSKQKDYIKFVEYNDKAYKDYYRNNPTYDCCNLEDEYHCFYKKELVERFKFLESFDYETLLKINREYILLNIEIEQTLNNDNKGFIIYLDNIEGKYWINDPSNCARYLGILPFTKK